MVPLTITPSVGNGVTTVFTLGAAPINLFLLRDRLPQLLGTDYSVSGKLVTFTAPPNVGDVMTALADGTLPTFTASTGAAQIRGYTTTELLASLRQRTFTSASSRDFDDASALRVLNEQAITYLMKLVAKRRTNFLVESVDIAAAAGAPNVQVPSVAMAGSVRAVTLIIGNIPYPLVEMDLPTAVGTNLTPFSTQFPTGYYWQGPYLVLWPTQSLNGTVRLHYHRRPSQVVLESLCVQITEFPGGAAAGNYRVSFGSLPAGFGGGTLIDVVSNSPNFYRWQTSQAIQALTSSTMDLPGPQPTSLAVGDWVCLAGTAPVVTDAPAEVIEALLQKTGVKMMEGKGSDETLQRLASGLAAAESDCGPLIEGRNTGAQRKLSAFPSAVGWPFGGF